MSEGKELIKSESMEIITQPEVILANAKIAAKALVEVISMKKKPVIFNNEQYLEFDDWQTCGQFYGYTVKTGDAVPVEIDGVKGAKAHADLISLKTGEIIGGADAYCMRDEDKWNTRPKYEYQGEGDNRQRVKVGDEPVPFFQLASMAQTRAGAKALRNRLAWVVVLAGYKPTPAEEMTGNEESRQDQSQNKYWCKEHKAVWFKKGAMKNYAHPIGDTGKWCNMPKEEKVEVQPETGEIIEKQAEPELPAAKPVETPLGNILKLTKSLWGTDKKASLAWFKNWQKENKCEGIEVPDMVKEKVEKLLADLKNLDNPKAPEGKQGELE